MKTELLSNLKIGLPSDDDRFKRLYTFLWCQMKHDATFYTHRYSIPRSDEVYLGMIKEWSERFQIIFLPLTYSHFGSLRLVELIHKHNMQLKTILYSASYQLKEDLAIPLFDTYIDSRKIDSILENIVSVDGGLYSGHEDFDKKNEEVKLKLSNSIESAFNVNNRISNENDIELLISMLLTTQGCFRFDPYSGRHPELAFRANIIDYKRRIFLEDQRDQFPRGASQKQVDDWKNKQYNISVYGDNAKINIESKDFSINELNARTLTLDEVIDRIFKIAIKEIVKNPKEFVSIINKLESLRDNDKNKTFAQKYNEFIQAAANHMTLLAPFIPSLSRFLG